MFFTKSQTPQRQIEGDSKLQDSDENFSDCDEYDYAITFDKFGHIDKSYNSTGVALIYETQKYQFSWLTEIFK